MAIVRIIVGADATGGDITKSSQPKLPIAPIIEKMMTIRVAIVAEIDRRNNAKVIITTRNINGINVARSF